MPDTITYEGEKLQTAGDYINGRIPKVALMDGLGNPIQSLKGALNIHQAGVHTSPINDSFHRHTGTITTLAVAASIGAISLTVASSVGFVAGDSIQIGDHTNDTTHTKILSVVGNVINLNRSLGHIRAIGTSVEIIIIDISSTSGSMAAPISYKIIPSLGVTWHIERFNLEMVHGTAGDLSLFGNLTALINGVLLRRYDGATATFSTYTVWISNEDIFLDTARIEFPVRASGGGSYATISVGSFADIGVTIKLDALAGDYLEVLVQDDITALTSFRIRAQGHYEGE